MTPVVLVGPRGGTHIAGCFERAAAGLGLAPRLVDARRAMDAPALVRRLNWWLRGRRPTWLRWFGREVVEAARATGARRVIATGIAPLDRHALEALRGLGVRTSSYLTDDPWNPAHRAPWFLEALPAYDVVASTRRAALPDLRRLVPGRVEWLPFAYDPELHQAVVPVEPRVDLLFVGGAEPARLPFLRAAVRSGLRTEVWGARWGRDVVLRPSSRGEGDPEALRAAGAAARLHLVLVRRANRDGHVMRTFEAAASGGCLLVEETEEHRELLGQTATYFRTPDELVAQARRLLAAPSDERLRLAHASRERITRGANTYGDRLRTLLAWSDA